MKTKIVLIILMSAFSFVAIGKQQSDIKNPEKYSINNLSRKIPYSVRGDQAGRVLKYLYLLMVVPWMIRGG